jgi:hypothetical protein
MSVLYLLKVKDALLGGYLSPGVEDTFTHPFDTRSFVSMVDAEVYAMPGDLLQAEMRVTGEDFRTCFLRAFTWGDPKPVPALKGIPRVGKLVAKEGVKEFDLVKKGS